MDSKNASSLAVSNICSFGLFDTFERPFELDVLKNSCVRQAAIDRVHTLISEAKSLEDLEVGPIWHVLLPKGQRYSLRKCALIDPLDTATYLGLVLRVADEIERHRVPIGDNIVYSYRFCPDFVSGTLFHSDYDFGTFLAETKKRSEDPEVRVMVKCDIASFYDRLNLHRLQSALEDMKVEKNVVSLIDQLLLHWAGRNSYGLPVGGNASRILAEALLAPTDSWLIERGIKFIRYVDDYRLFAPNAQIGHHWLAMLMERLSEEGLTLNSSKTVLDDVSILRINSVNAAPDANSNASPESRERVVFYEGYSSRVALQFQELTDPEIQEYRATNPLVIARAIGEKVVISEADIKKFVCSVLVNLQVSLFESIVEVMKKAPLAVPYCVDMLLKNQDRLPPEIRDKIATEAGLWLNGPDFVPDYLVIELARLLGQKGFANGAALLAHYRGLKKTSSPIVGRALLRGLQGQITRGEAMDLRRQFFAATNWERRAFIPLMRSALASQEADAWCRAIRPEVRADLFACAQLGDRKGMEYWSISVKAFNKAQKAAGLAIDEEVSGGAS